MWRRIRTGLGIVGLLLCLCVAVAWWRSEREGEFVGRMWLNSGGEDSGVASAGVWSGRGGIGWGWTDLRYPPGVDAGRWLSGYADRAGKMDGRVRWWDWPSGGSQALYPFASGPGRRGVLDELGFCRRAVDVTAPKPWATDGSQLRRMRYAGTAVPYWFLAAVTGAGPGVMFSRRAVRRGRARWRRRRGCCVMCGFDLRATPGRCPECGTAVGGNGDRTGIIL